MKALERLYERKAAVNELIRSLEAYREAETARRRECIRLSAQWRCA
jgi:hypothetical protein